MSIRYCKNSTITEAWALVVGLPARIDDTEASALFRASRDRFPDIQLKPAIVAVQADNPAPPFWRNQVAWNSERHLARFGHRYLSVHFVRRGEERYLTFEETFEPALRAWLQLYSGTLTRESDKHPVDSLGFGYVNRFEFEPEDFDLSRYFRMNFALTIDGLTNVELQRFDIGSVLFDVARGMHLSINLSVEGPSETVPRVQVQTKVFAEKRGPDAASFFSDAQLGESIVRAKEAAKAAFFGLATDETHRIMGAVTDAAAKSS